MARCGPRPCTRTVGQDKPPFFITYPAYGNPTRTQWSQASWEQGPHLEKCEKTSSGTGASGHLLPSAPQTAPTQGLGTLPHPHARHWLEPCIARCRSQVLVTSCRKAGAGGARCETHSSQEPPPRAPQSGGQWTAVHQTSVQIPALPRTSCSAAPHE